jgi:hypothetical protein
MIVMLVKLVGLAFRFASGRQMSGKRRTNATFTQRATQSHRAGQASAWDCMPGWQKSMIRIGGVAGLPIGLCMFCAYPKLTLFLGACAAAGGLAMALQAFDRKERNGAHYRNVLWPLHHTLTGLLKVQVSDPDTWLSVPADYRTNPGAVVRVRVPLNNALNDATRKKIEQAIRAKLGIGDWPASWQTAGANPSVTLRPLAPMPNKIDLFDFAPHARACTKRSEVSLGVGRGRTIVNVDLDGESPHVLIAGETGSGKSVVALWIALQVLMSGGRIMICDIKGSHRWARNMPGVTYYHTTEAIHGALVWLAAEAQRRNSMSWECEKPVELQRILLMFEEASATLKQLKELWADIREKNDSKYSPAIRGYSELMAMGRSACINVVLIAQSATANATGGTENRENFGLRLMGRCTANQVAMLTGVRGGPTCSGHPGRWLMFMSGKFTEIQVPFAGKDEDPRVRARIAQLLGSVPCPTQVPEQEQEVGHGTVVGHETADPEPQSGPVPIGLREAVESGLIGDVSLAAARKKITRAKDEAPPIAGVAPSNEKLYDPDVLAAWFNVNKK